MSAAPELKGRLSSLAAENILSSLRLRFAQLSFYLGVSRAPGAVRVCRRDIKLMSMDHAAASSRVQPATRYLLIEPLRGLAALWVFCFHYQFAAGLPAALHDLINVGYLGVAMFFVLSGFCITASARAVIRSDESTWRFLYRRVRRIYPPYWASIIVVVVIPFVMEAISSLKTGTYLRPSVTNPNYGFLAYNSLDWLSVATLARVFSSPNAADLQSKFTTINPVYWTLAIEVQFYAVTALVLVWRDAFYLLLSVVTALSLPVLLMMGSQSGIFLPFWPMFAIGVAVYWMCESGFKPSRLLGTSASWITAPLALGLFGVFVWYVSRGFPVQQTWFALCFGGFLLIMEGLDRPFVEHGLHARGVLTRACIATIVALGAMSYSLYLLHGRLQWLSMQLLRQVLPQGTLMFDAATITVTTVFCYLFYLLCERPFIRRNEPHRSRTHNHGSFPRNSPATGIVSPGDDFILPSRSSQA